ncbi:MAG: hypothetical protein LBU85_10780 [Treponema sp.]|jgi:hypothetical protein|nr:hypothetical protein [Treponema sp.]
MKKNKILFILVFFANIIYAQETNDNTGFDSGTAGEITIYGERQEDFAPESKNAYVLNQLNGSLSDRKQFIETDFLEESGFRRTGNVKYRKTESSEKTWSVLHGVGHLFSFGLIPMKPYFEVEYGKLPRGEVYKFESVFVKSNFKDVTPEVLTLIELEYMLQIEFLNGIIIQDNINYYTDENINKFEKLILGLPDLPESVNQAKKRYSNELRKIKAALERRRNPGENNLRALQNLRDSLNIP